MVDGKHDQPDPLTAPIVREVFERYADGDSVAEITRTLNTRGIKTRAGNKQLTFNSFRNMIRNRRYLGEYSHGRTTIPDAFPAIVTLELSGCCSDFFCVRHFWLKQFI